MEAGREERTDSGRRRVIRWMAACFFGSLAVFTLFSNTWLTLMLPKVLTQQASTGSLTHTIQGSGVLSPLESVELKNDTGWKVQAVHVKQGGTVAQGEALITFDSKATELQIWNEQNTLKQQNLQLGGLFDSYVEASKNGDPVQIKNAKREVDKYKLEIEARERNIQALEQNLQQGRELRAPFAGIVTAIQATEGMTSPSVTIARLDEGFALFVTLPAAQASLVQLGEKVQVQVKGKQSGSEAEETKLIDGEIANMDDAPSDRASSTATASKIMRIRLQDESLKGGETASIHLRKGIQADKEALLLSKSAIREDSGGTYVYVIEEKKGTLGNGFYVGKSYVKIVDSTEQQVAVQGGIFPSQSVVIESSEPLQEGERVRL
ncbi:efflux RND transporter periplasmic adaptor subunit [Paenibacillus filicis]|uniref:Efflux RND transporter periplasmic adaptor subunit n=1 Tax=Paenibacillus filicis TaxID=669464 RepID=A0ABU9DCK0_9BACL